ncbi:MAG: 16S rRNA (cytosine(1402)-N(4))-methyltransferase RsmH [Mycoplasmatales bacterium]
MFKHETVLLYESVETLNIKPNGVYVDATLGGAGHSCLIHEQLSDEGTLICFDQDDIAIENAKIKFKDVSNVILIKSNFLNLKSELLKYNINNIDGILFDLGVSSMQIDTDERGFSYMHDGPLDMRMNQDSKLSAYEVINTYDFHMLMEIFNKYGEEKFSKQIARAIENKREIEPIKTTKELSNLILESIPKKAFYGAKSHPAKRVFQAIRIEVNKELDVFESTLIDAFEILNAEGYISVITFHSLEDRICKYHFKKWCELDKELKRLPLVPNELMPPGFMQRTKPILPSKEEMEHNSRSKSAKLRTIKKVRYEV